MKFFFLNFNASAHLERLWSATNAKVHAHIDFIRAAEQLDTHVGAVWSFEL